jgi:hypothetical protein
VKDTLQIVNAVADKVLAYRPKKKKRKKKKPNRKSQ